MPCEPASTGKAYGVRLPRSGHLIHALERRRTRCPSPLPDDLDGAEVSDLMDTLQKRLGDAHTAVVETWFLPGGRRVKRLLCVCGRAVYFDNHSCSNCGRQLAFDPATLTMQAETEVGDGLPLLQQS